MDDLKEGNPQLVSAIAAIKRLRDFERPQTDAFKAFSKAFTDALSATYSIPARFIIPRAEPTPNEIIESSIFKDLVPEEKQKLISLAENLAGTQSMSFSAAVGVLESACRPPSGTSFLTAAEAGEVLRKLVDSYLPEIDPCKTETWVPDTSVDKEIIKAFEKKASKPIFTGFGFSNVPGMNEEQCKAYMAHLMGTTSGIFEFRNGDRFEIPPPGPGWEMSGSEKDFWPHVFVDEVFEDHLEDEYETEYRVCHKAGLIMLAEYKARIEEETVRLIEYTSWYWRGENNGTD